MKNYVGCKHVKLSIIPFSNLHMQCNSTAFFFLEIWSMQGVISSLHIFSPPLGSRCQRHNKHLSVKLDMEMGNWHWESTECPLKVRQAGGPPVCPVCSADQVALSWGCLLLPHPLHTVWHVEWHGDILLGSLDMEWCVCDDSTGRLQCASSGNWPDGDLWLNLSACSLVSLSPPLCFKDCLTVCTALTAPLDGNIYHSNSRGAAKVQNISPPGVVTYIHIL